MNSARLFGVFIIFFITITSAYACQCPRRHPQTQYCKADWVLSGVAISQNLAQSVEAKYSISMGIYLKSNKPPKGVQDVYSNAYPKSCRPVFTMFNAYYLTGRFQGPKYYTSNCNFVKKRDEMTPYQITGFDSEYKNGCDCNIKYCSGPLCNFLQSPNTCLIKSSERDCYTCCSMCKRVNGICKWVVTPEYNECITK